MAVLINLSDKQIVVSDLGNFNNSNPGLNFTLASSRKITLADTDEVKKSFTDGEIKLLMDDGIMSYTTSPMVDVSGSYMGKTVYADA